MREVEPVPEGREQLRGKAHCAPESFPFPRGLDSLNRKLLAGAMEDGRDARPPSTSVDPQPFRPMRAISAWKRAWPRKRVQARVQGSVHSKPGRAHVFRAFQPIQ